MVKNIVHNFLILLFTFIYNILSHFSKYSFEILKDHYDPLIQEKLLCLYQWGSRVYGTNNEKSDWDFVAVISDEWNNEEKNFPFGRKTFVAKFRGTRTKECEVIDIGNQINVTFVGYNQMKVLVYLQKIEFLESLFLEKKFVWVCLHSVKKKHHKLEIMFSN